MARDQFHNNSQMRQFSKPVTDFAEQFVLMQSEREKADYVPSAAFARFQVLYLVRESRRRMEAFNNVPRAERRAFAAHALWRAR